MGYAQEELDKTEIKIEQLTDEILRKEQVILDLLENAQQEGIDDHG